MHCRRRLHLCLFSRRNMMCCWDWCRDRDWELAGEVVVENKARSHVIPPTRRVMLHPHLSAWFFHLLPLISPASLSWVCNVSSETVPLVHKLVLTRKLLAVDFRVNCRRKLAKRSQTWLPALQLTLERREIHTGRRSLEQGNIHKKKLSTKAPDKYIFF